MIFGIIINENRVMVEDGRILEVQNPGKLECKVGNRVILSFNTFFYILQVDLT